ncbi:sigma-70 family RNA polymerase sigma factor [Pedobacter sp. PAMC26386]|nr:sigma-70 family RNA polymerase sigma factor [Pedobacter sp. PAMC26386]
MLNTESLVLIEKNRASVRIIYDRYGGMLLGYLFEIVKDRNKAEEYLVKIFCDISQHFDELNWNDSSGWCQLQRFAKNSIKPLTGTSSLIKNTERQSLLNSDSDNKYPDHFSQEQHHIFYGIYYYGKSIEKISKELNRTEESILKTLKEAFSIMRNICEN